MEIEEMVKVLKDCKGVKNIERHKFNSMDLFDRMVSFLIFDQKYIIEWWKNVSYLHIGNKAIVPFSGLFAQNTWPIDSDIQLQFRDLRHEVCAIIPIKYDMAKSQEIGKVYTLKNVKEAF